MNSPSDTRQHFVSPLGIVLSFIGVAVGLGNVWRFPYMVAAFGGGAFLLVYLIILFAFGIPALLAELTLGRISQHGPVGTFSRIGLPGGKWWGWLLFLTVLMGTSYYTVVVGWVLKYFLISLGGQITHINPANFFDRVLGGFFGQFIPTAVVLTLVMFVLFFGINKGVERVSKVFIPLLFALFVVLIFRTLTLPGAVAGLKFYFLPDFSKLNWSVVTAAMGQVFFSLSLGGTFLLTYASYLPKDSNLNLNALFTGLGDGLAAIFAGLVIVPAAYLFGLQLNSGPPLTFVTAPLIFQNLPGGDLFAAIFFFSLFIAAYLSDVAAFEVLVVTFQEEWGWQRRPAVLLIGAIELSLACLSMISLDFLLKNDLIWGSTMQPVGSALVIIGLTWFVGRQRTLHEINPSSRTLPWEKIWFVWIKFVLPLGIAIILIMGLKDVFNTFF